MTSRLILSRRQWLSGASLFALAGCAGQSTDTTIWVGHIGPVGRRNESAINGIQQTLADLREGDVSIAGRSIGVRHVECKDKARARAEASRLLSVNRVACLIVGSGVEGVADVVSIARSHGAFVVVLDGTADRTLADQAVWLGIDPEASGEMLARYAIAKGRRAYRSSVEDSAKEVERGFAREFTKAGGKIVETHGANWQATEVGRGRRVGEVAKGGVTPYLEIGDPPLPRNEHAERWALTMQPDPASLPAEGRTWAERYEKRFGARPDDDAILAADAIALIADGLREIAGDDRRTLVEELMGRSEIAGLTGPITRKDGRTIRPMWVERTVKGVRVGVEAVPQ